MVFYFVGKIADYLPVFKMLNLKTKWGQKFNANCYN